jgi:hypothetical protein
MNSEKRILWISITSALMGLCWILFFQVLNKSQNKLSSRTDINRDGKTDSLDAKLVYLKYGSNCNNCIEDVNKDYEIDGNDVLLVISNIEGIK